jgi:hypothetical protein
LLDYETNKTFKEDILLTDLKDTTYGVILINLENVNDNAPSIEKAFDIIYVSDKMNNDEVVYKIITSDLDNSKLDYSIIEDQYNLFYLIGNTIKINNPSVIGTIKPLSYNIAISISDGAHNCTLTLWVRDQDENIAKVKFYPNPCSDNLIVEIGPERKTNIIEIANLKGQKVYETIIGKNELGLKKINLGFLNSGYYIIKFKGDNFVDKSNLLIYR